MRGFLLVDKAQDITSRGVVDQVRRMLKVKKVGHAGTLDPMATGLLVVAVGPVTRLIRWVQDAEKEYEATVLLGVGTSTLDAEGDVTEEVDMSGATREDVEAQLPNFRGEIDQIPPMVSALKVGGKRLYKLAREGIEVERRARTVTISELELTGFDSGSLPLMHLRVVCSKGTYIRTLGDDIAIALGGRGHLTALRRTRIGDLRVAEAVVVEAATVDSLIDPARALGSLTAVVVDADVAKLVGYGRAIPNTTAHGEGTDVRLMNLEGAMLAVYQVEGDLLKPEVVLA